MGKLTDGGGNEAECNGAAAGGINGKKRTVKKAGRVAKDIQKGEKSAEITGDEIENGRGGESPDELVEQALFESALGGNTTALIFWLKNKYPEKWRDKPEMGAAGGGFAEELLAVWKKKRAEARRKRG